MQLDAAARTRSATTWTSPGSRATRSTSSSRTRSRTCERPDGRLHAHGRRRQRVHEVRHASRRRRRDAAATTRSLLPARSTTVPQTAGAGASFSGIVREDDFAEGELDMDALGRWNDADTASPTFAGVLINRSEVNPHRHGPGAGRTWSSRATRRGRRAALQVERRRRRPMRSSTACACATTTIACCTTTPIRCTSRRPTLFQPPAMM